MATGRRLETRRKLLEAAEGLFYGGGIRATGVDAVAEEAGVTKVTLYSHFTSKDDLVAAYLGARDLRWRESLEDVLSACDSPGDKLLAVFDAYREWLVDGGLRGCAFVNSVAEFPEPSHPVDEVIRQHKASLRGRIRTLATEAGAGDPDLLSERLFVFLEGVYVTAALEDDEELFDRLRPAFADMVRAANGTGA